MFMHKMRSVYCRSSLLHHSNHHTFNRKVQEFCAFPSSTAKYHKEVAIARLRGFWAKVQYPLKVSWCLAFAEQINFASPLLLEAHGAAVFGTLDSAQRLAMAGSLPEILHLHKIFSYHLFLLQQWIQTSSHLLLPYKQYSVLLQRHSTHCMVFVQPCSCMKVALNSRIISVLTLVHSKWPIICWLRLVRASNKAWCFVPDYRMPYIEESEERWMKLYLISRPLTWRGCWAASSSLGCCTVTAWAAGGTEGIGNCMPALKASTLSRSVLCKAMRVKVMWWQHTQEILLHQWKQILLSSLSEHYLGHVKQIRSVVSQSVSIEWSLFYTSQQHKPMLLEFCGASTYNSYFRTVKALLHCFKRIQKHHLMGIASTSMPCWV